MIFAEVLPLEIFASRHLRSSLLSFTTNLLFAMIIPLVGSTRHGKNQCSRKITTPLFSWCNPLAWISNQFDASVIPGRGQTPEPGIHNPGRGGYGFRTRRFAAPRNDGPICFEPSCAEQRHALATPAEK